MATALRIERNRDFVERRARNDLLSMYRSALEELGGRSEAFFELGLVRSIPTFYHLALPIMITPNIPGQTEIDIHVESYAKNNPKELARGFLLVEELKNRLERKGYDFSKARFEDNGYALSVPTSTKADLVKILRDTLV